MCRHPRFPSPTNFNVRLEELAAEELRHLDITTSAFGISGTGQVNQLAYYDEFARYLRPALLVLVFVSNDFMNNAPILDGLNREWTRTDSPMSPRHEARMGPSRCNRLIPLLRVPDWPSHPGTRASRTA